jgi:hypothetical protein
MSRILRTATLIDHRVRGDEMTNETGKSATQEGGQPAPGVVADQEQGSVPEASPSINPDALSGFVSEAEAIKKAFVGPSQTWYTGHIKYPFLCFRVCGIGTIVLSAALPAVSLVNPDSFSDLPRWLAWMHLAKDPLVASMSVAIAILTGLGSFYRWEKSWRGREMSKYALDAHVAQWQLELAAAKTFVLPADSQRQVYSATSALIAKVNTVTSSETQDFFSGMAFPQSMQTNSGDGAAGRPAAGA